jgi:hypothetical protein
VALWLLDAPGGEAVLREAAGAENIAAGTFVAWHASAAPGRAFELGLKMLPPPGAEAALRVYNDRERASGAMMLALGARTDEQKRLAIERITSRLVGGDAGGEDDPDTIAAFRCALLALGRSEHRDVVRLIRARQHLRAMVLTAMLAAGDKEALDYLLFNKYLSAEKVGDLLASEGLGDVLARFAPALPAVDAPAGGDLRLWQVMILRRCWAVRRAHVAVGARP